MSDAYGIIGRMEELPTEENRKEIIGPGVRIVLMEGPEAQKRWEDIEAAILTAFEASTYNDQGYTIVNPVAYTRKGVEGGLPVRVAHAVALDENDNIFGGVFCIPIDNPHNETDCDIGWFFLSPGTSARQRLWALDNLMETVRTTALEAGYTHVVTNMGTPEGAKTMARRYGMEHQPLPGQENRWVRALGDGALNRTGLRRK